MEAEKYQITDKDGNEVLADVSGSLFDFAWWTKHFSHQTHFERSEVSEWHYT
jgi:hypothetical protein